MDPRRMCPHCRAFITTSDRTCPYCNEPVGPPARERINPMGALGGLIPHARYNTVLILLINLGLYMATALHSMNTGAGSAMSIDGYTLVAFGAEYSPLVHQQGEWWRLVTAGFLHGGLLHILMNSWALFDLGAQVDEVYGSSRMLVIYFFSNIAGFYVSSLWRPGPSIGASAALFGLIGAMIAVGMRHRSAYGAMIRAAYVRWLVWALAFSLLPGIDMAAHVGGLVGGFGLAWLAGEPRYTSTTTERMWRIAAGAAILVTAFCFLKMYLWYSHSAQ
jgi:rhomboid protease GluP